MSKIHKEGMIHKIRIFINILTFAKRITNNSEIFQLSLCHTFVVELFIKGDPYFID